jgi:hypothetical protein
MISYPYGYPSVNTPFGFVLANLPARSLAKAFLLLIKLSTIFGPKNILAQQRLDYNLYRLPIYLYYQILIKEIRNGKLYFRNEKYY